MRCAEAARHDRTAPQRVVICGEIGLGPLPCSPHGRIPSAGGGMSAIYTDRLELLPITLEMVEAVLAGRREDAESLAGVRFPEAWPGRALVERAFACPLGRLREDPASY